jgi:hypothetical protein
MRPTLVAKAKETEEFRQYGHLFGWNAANRGCGMIHQITPDDIMLIADPI